MKEFVEEALKLQGTIVETIEKHRFEDLKIEHAEEFVSAVRDMKAREGQNEYALNLYRMSVINHYETLLQLAGSVTPFESAFLEWMQTPVVIERRFQLDSAVREPVEIFAKTIH